MCRKKTKQNYKLPSWDAFSSWLQLFFNFCKTLRATKSQLFSKAVHYITYWQNYTSETEMSLLTKYIPTKGMFNFC